MQLTQKVRIFPTPQQEEVLWKLSERCRLLYNFALAERIHSWEKTGKSVTYIKQQNDLVDIKKKYPSYGWVYSKVLQMVLREVDADFKSFYQLRKNGDMDANPPRFKGRKHFTTMVYNQSGFKVEKGKVALSHFYNETPLEFKIPEKFEFDRVYQVAVFKDDDGNFYISVTYEKTEKPYIDNRLYQAIDLGVTKTVTAVNMYGRFLEVKNPRPDKYWQPKIQEVQSKQDHCKKNSRRWNRYNNKLKKMMRKSANQSKDFQHKLSKKLIENTRANTIIIGDLSVKQMAMSKKGDRKNDKGLHRAVQSNGYLSRFAGFLTYKAQLAGKRVIEISEKDTTKMCCVCGKKHDMKLQDRVMKCDCGNVIDRDRNSAVNIMVRFLSQNASVDRLLSFKESILRQTGLAIASYSQEASSERMG